MLARETRCDYLGVDASAEAVALARERGRGLGCRFVTSTVPPLPPGRFDVVLLLETMLAFPDKEPLVDAVAHALPDGGRFAFTLEEGAPLDGRERAAMPDADTVWLQPLDDLCALLDRSGLRIRWQEEWTAAHAETAAALTAAYASHADAIAAVVGRAALEDLLAAHRLWVEWLGSGRVRKYAVVAART
jgi:SAM-dependent methyltransferase